MMNEDVSIDKTLDVTGLTDLRLRQIASETLRSIDKGRVLRIVTGNRSARTHIPALCEELGSSILSIHESGGLIYLTVRR